MAGTNIQAKQAPWYTGGLSQVLRPGANQGDVFYLNDAAGDDTNTGRTPAVPLASFKAALALCTNDRNDTIVVLDFYGGVVAEDWPIVVNKSMVSIIGVPLGGAIWPQVNPTGDFAAFSVTAAGVEICYLSINGGDTSGAIEMSPAPVWGIEVHHCFFGEMGTAQDGIRMEGPYAKVWACRFGHGLIRDGVRVGTNATRGMVGAPGLEPNWFRGVPGVAINVTNQFAQGGIFDNRISIPADVAGAGITLGVDVAGVHIDGNSAHFGQDQSAGGPANPYLDNALNDANTWGLNYWGVLATPPA